MNFFREAIKKEETLQSLSKQMNNSIRVNDKIMIINPNKEGYCESKKYLSYKGYYGIVMREEKEYYWVYLLGTYEMRKIKIHRDYLMKIK